MIKNFSDSAWEKLGYAGENKGFSVSEDGSFIRLYDDNPYAAQKKVMYTAEIEDGKTYNLTALYSVKKIKHELMIFGVISLFNSEGEMTRRYYMKRPSRDKLDIIFKSNKESKIRVELGIKSFGDVCFYVPSLKECETEPKRIVRLSAVHTYPVASTYENNLKRIEDGIDKAAEMGADIICFAETMNDRGAEDLAPGEAYEKIDGRFCTMMRKKAKEKKVFLFFTFHELDENGAKRNTAVLVDRNGEIVGRHHKVNLAMVEYDNGLVPGDEYRVFDTEIGKIGMLICWDSYFPEGARALALRGAEILLISTAGNPTHRHFARAKENGVYVVVSCCGWKDEGVEPTKIINPRGELLSECGEEGGVAISEVDLSDIESQNIYWLSVGSANTEPNNIYMNELRPEMFEKIIPEDKYNY